MKLKYNLFYKLENFFNILVVLSLVFIVFVYFKLTDKSNGCEIIYVDQYEMYLRCTNKFNNNIGDSLLLKKDLVESDTSNFNFFKSITDF
jgi:hypothetical protein